MKTASDLKQQLMGADQKPYPAYKELKGSYRFKGYTLFIDHVQGDPFAAPSRLHVLLSCKEAGYPPEYRDKKEKRIALSDVCLRNFGTCVGKYSFLAKGSGKSGLIGVTVPGQQILSRSSCQIREDGSVLLRFEVGFPANGRRINSKELMKILFDYIPACVEKGLVFANINQKKALEAVHLYEDQICLRKICKENGWISFVADGSVLPRQSGISQKPMRNAKPFSSPDSMRKRVCLPYRGEITGMAVKEGITLIVGGGYHGKSTLLKALETGIYHHIAGDGREYVVTDETAFKIRAEDGRSISGTDISMFINHLPNGRDTTQFWTEDASGSTSQAANVAEAAESGVKVLLIDEDTSATNFMVRDELMAKVIAKEKEPITPFLSRAGQLYKQKGISTVLVAGSSGAYFSIADVIIQMDEYQAYEITEMVRSICGTKKEQFSKDGEKEAQKRNVGIKPMERKKGSVKVKQYGLDSFSVGKETVELRGLEQILDYEQTTLLSKLLLFLLEKMEKEKGKKPLLTYVEETFSLYEKNGMETLFGISQPSAPLAQVRKQDFAACVNRYRGFVKNM